MPVITLGCPDATEYFQMGHVPGKDSGVTRMQDEAGNAPADRRW